jgi:hypothetical protein
MLISWVCHKQKMSADEKKSSLLQTMVRKKARKVLYEVLLVSYGLGPNSKIVCTTRRIRPEQKDCLHNQARTERLSAQPGAIGPNRKTVCTTRRRPCSLRTSRDLPVQTFHIRMDSRSFYSTEKQNGTDRFSLCSASNQDGGSTFPRNVCVHH